MVLASAVLIVSPLIILRLPARPQPQQEAGRLVWQQHIGVTPVSNGGPRQTNTTGQPERRDGPKAEPTNSPIYDPDGLLVLQTTNRWSDFKIDLSQTNDRPVNSYTIAAYGFTNWFAGEVLQVEARTFTKSILLDLEDDRGTVEIDMAHRWRPYDETGVLEETDRRIMPPYPSHGRLLIMLPDGHWLTITPATR